MNDYSMSIKYGVIAGISMIVITLLIYFVSVTALVGMLPRVVYVLLIFAMIWGGITARREMGSFNGFGHAFLTVFIISITATMLFDTFNYVLFKVIDPSIPVMIKQKTIENVTDIMEKLGTTDEKTEQALQKVKDQDFTPTITILMARYAESAVIGAILSALIGLFVNRPDERPQIKAEE